jgi:anti-sigma factor ChrR (cupin superfamily)
MGETTASAANPLASQHVKPQSMEWRRTTFEGVEMKPLYVDRDSGLLTVLLRMAPGAALPDHEHVLVEQTYVLEGRLVDKEGPEVGLAVGPGEYVARPAGSRHAAWMPEGGLMVAIFQMPNKFFAPGGGVVDFLGNDWEAHWGAAMARHRAARG